jgi:GH35 family endo-1,4-beta-xylanase
MDQGEASPARPAVAAMVNVPAGGTPLLPEDVTTRLDCVGLADESLVQFERAKVSGQPFQDAIRVNTLRKADQVWRIQTQFFFDKPIRKGDVLFASFAMRGSGTVARQPRVEVILGQFGEPWLNFAILGVSPRDTWDRYYIKAIAPADFDGGKARITLNYGFDPQTVEIADLRVVNYGTSVNFDALPISRITYVGREMDAPWRNAAQERIEKYRKADLSIVVRDASGNPVPNAQVKVEQTKHDFAFGMAVRSKTIVHNKSPDGDRYRAMVKELWPYVTIDWDTVWIRWEMFSPSWEQNRDTATKAIDWLHSNGINVHGCHIIWGGEQWIPQDLLTMRNNPAEVRKRWDSNIRNLLGTLKGKVTQRNAVNEPISQKFIWDVLGKGAMIETFKMAHEIDPTLKPALNDYNDFAGWDDAGRKAYLDLLKYVKASGAPMHVVGLQGHFGSSVRSPDEVYKILDEFAEVGLPIHVSEIDVNVADEQFQADYLRDMHIILFSHPSVSQITQWVFWEPTHWLPSAALWRADWTIKPAGEAWKKLVLEDWMTKTTVSTDATGAAKSRGFKGTYKISAIVDSKTIEKTIELNGPAAQVEVK